ncbi:efflux RND transporter permease subunit [Seonamhaeicola sediminis]|uniref:Efflux RND transporter permease subunit n=1 Tax=Seonamhaeicola sediminis TaxID=2528206 RepID=A0A562YDN9_9FLAO|nr:efflux RND transporter permease subunit [Seonamhaeicola sediminis]TWO32231.1 efflux RND transporter permease subunit [Seonamhaeicola sediminis]
MSKLHKEFKPSSWAINNKTVVYVIVGIFLFLGVSAYFSLPRESFPEVKETKIYISTPYPGNTAEDIEKLIVDPLEDRVKNISNVTEVLSTSQEDYGMIIIEFDENISVEAARQKVKDEVDSEKASEDWPTFNGAKVEPDVFDLNFSEEMPILNINLTGDYPVDKLKEFAEILQDDIEDLEEIKAADIRGAQEKEVEVAVDIYKMMAAKVSFNDVIGAIQNGNMTMSAGNLITSGQRRTVRVIGEISNPEQLENFVVKSDNGAVYLRDVATVSFIDEDHTTFARDFGKNVVMLDVKKRSGKNMVAAADAIYKIIKTSQETNTIPKDVKITTANDQSQITLNQVDDLVNNIIFGIILVTTVLMFFLGFRNALFVGFAIPMSMVMAFMIVQILGYTMNTMILFGLIMGLGMLVDNGIVLVENVYRLMDEEGMSRIEAAKKGIGEIAMPIIISTLTTVAAFIPLGMWPGMMGEFMIYFPITLSIVLGSSLFVAVFINSVMVSQFMKIEEDTIPLKSLIRITIILVLLGLFIYFIGGAIRGLGTLLIFSASLLWAYKYLIKGATHTFKDQFLPRLENLYEKQLRNALKGKMPYVYIGGTVLILIISFMAFGISVGTQRTNIEFFPDNTPKQIMVYIEYPEGTAIEKTNEITKSIENRVYKVIRSEKYTNSTDDSKNFLVESVVSQVGEGAGNPFTDGGSAAEMPNKGKITATMREFKFRRDANNNIIDSEELRKDIQNALKGIYPGVSISVEKDPVGPPTGYPINIEIEGKDYDQLITVAENIKKFIDSKNVPGIDQLKIDVNRGKPVARVDIDREKSGELGVSAGQVGQQLRNSLFGAKAGVYKKDGEDYDINVRFNEDLRYNTSALFNQNIIFRDQATGQLKEVPISAVAKQVNTSSFSSIKHRDYKRVVTVYSALAPGFIDANIVVSQIKAEMESYGDTYGALPSDIKIDYTGQLEEQAKEQAFLNKALLAGLGLIMLILIFQFGSVSKPTIIMGAIFLSFAGVFLGLVFTGWSFVIMMTMMGIISLAGIVVNNGVVLLDYTQLLIDRKRATMDDIDVAERLPVEDIKEAIVKGGKARLRPVLLTAITTVFGLIPLAIGFNIDFFSLFNNFDPNIYIGGDNVIFWGPLAWTVIFGLIFATFLTLIIVPVLFFLVNKLKRKIFLRKLG